MARKQTQHTKEKKSPHVAYLLRLVAKLVVDLEGISERSMFGCIAYFVNGNIFALIDPKDEELYVKITDKKENDILAKKEGAKPFMPGGDAMNYWLGLPEKLVKSEAKVEKYVTLAYSYAAKLPEKLPKSRARKI